EPAARQRVDAGGGLVEEDNRRLVEEGAAERQALAPAAGQIACAHVLPPLEPGHGDHESAPLFQLPPLEAVDAAEEPDVLIHRQSLVEREALRHVADAAL